MKLTVRGSRSTNLEQGLPNTECASLQLTLLMARRVGGLVVGLGCSYPHKTMHIPVRKLEGIINHARLSLGRLRNEGVVGEGASLGLQ